MKTTSKPLNYNPDLQVDKRELLKIHKSVYTKYISNNINGITRQLKNKLIQLYEAFVTEDNIIKLYFHRMPIFINALINGNLESIYEESYKSIN